MAEQPDLYSYIVALVEARTWKNAGDITSGASDQHGASNRCYAQGGRAEELRQSLRQSIDYEDSLPEQCDHGYPLHQCCEIPAGTTDHARSHPQDPS